MARALKVMDLLLHSGGFGLVVLDAGDVPSRMLRRVPLAYWFRFLRAVENTPTIFLLLDQESNAGSCASLVLRLGLEPSRWMKPEERQPSFQPNFGVCLLRRSQVHVEVVRSRLASVAGMHKMPSFAPRNDTGPAAHFSAKTQWST